MQLISEETCIECAWGSTYSDGQIMLDAEYTSLNEEYDSHYLAKQLDYKRETGSIDGNRAKIHGWRMQQPENGYYFTQEVRIYDPQTGKLKARMTALCKRSGDIEITKQIFKTIHFL